MAADYLTWINNEELIQMYNYIGDKLQENIDCKIDQLDVLVISAMSKRKLNYKSRYGRGLPKSKEWL